MIEIAVDTLVWGALTGMMVLGGAVFGYYCALKQTIKLAAVVEPDEQRVLDRQTADGDQKALSADDIDRIDDWGDDSE